MGFLKGRTNRATYWMQVGLIVVTLWVMSLFIPAARLQEVVLVFLCVPRLHDLGRSGWWVLAGIGVEIAGIAAAFMLPSDWLEVGLVGATLLVFGMVIALGCVRGQSGPNRFGPPPKPGVQWKYDKPRKQATERPPL